ncbi:complement C1q tumor necrosis factor-related protein 4 [Lepisosteus oculatus]|uniref:complement C1q tumor necrosis factor-related protein 4 n=1 Tax=Lepisosteus oculatus TaxID=7918 RepID=UPI00370F8958
MALRSTVWHVASLTCLLVHAALSSPFHPHPGRPYQSAFSAARTEGMVGGPQKAVTFDKLFVNVGDDFNPDTGRFRCRVPGAYYFAFTVGKHPRKRLSVMLVKNGQEVQAIVYDEHRHRRRKVQSQSVMLSLRPMDTVWLLLHGDAKYALYSNKGPYTTFSGYLVYPDLPPGYPNKHVAAQPPGQPHSGCPPLWAHESKHALLSELWAEEEEEPRSAFSVARTRSLLGEATSRGEKQALSFDVEYVNIGGHFDKSSGRFTCRFPGAYYFAFTVGKHPSRCVSVKLVKNGGDVQAMVFDEDDSKHRAMQSQSLMLSLREGETVWLYSQPHERFAVYSNQGRYITFTGFLIYPESAPRRAQKHLARTRF